MTIKQWSGNVVERTYTGHTDSVRALCEVPGLGFVSGSHDTTLKAWALDGRCLATLQGHTALVYACAATSALLASGAHLLIIF
jgi:phospholipase A-2-activating protein